MTAPKPQTNTNTDKKPFKMPPRADYSDVVTDEHIARIKTLVPESEHEDAETVAGPAW